MKKYTKDLEDKINASGHYYRLHFPDEKTLTYVGVLTNYFETEDESQLPQTDNINGAMYVTQGWNLKTDETIPAYINIYINAILPEIDPNKALESYTIEDFDSIMESIRSRYQHVEEETIERFRYLLERVYIVGVNNNLFEDTMGLCDSPVEENLSDLTEEKARILLRPKSLSVAHELNILRRFKASDICTMEGEELVAFLQFFTGLRNEEATGVNFGDFRKLSLSGRTVLYVYKTSRGSKGRLSLKMKTSNARRVIPIFRFLAERLEIRRKHIEGLFPEEDVSHFRIGCRGTDYYKPMNPRKLTDSGRELILATAPESENEKSYFVQMLARLRVEGVPVEEKSPTAYLFRRNYATHMHNLGLDQSSMEATIGHELLDPNDSRHHFSNEDALEKIHDVFEFHPFNSFFSENRIIHNGEVSTGNRIAITMQPGIHFRMMLNEPNDETLLEMAETQRKDFIFTYSTRSGSLGETVDIRGLVNESYKPDAEN